MTGSATCQSQRVVITRDMKRHVHVDCLERHSVLLFLFISAFRLIFYKRRDPGQSGVHLQAMSSGAYLADHGDCGVSLIAERATLTRFDLLANATFSARQSLSVGGRLQNVIGSYSLFCSCARSNLIDEPMTRYGESRWEPILRRIVH